ncbi:MAG: divalent-cation tolerance protein CutA [Verrucomicrobiota bacterium]
MGELTECIVGWTTVSTEQVASQLAKSLVEEGLATCVQIDSGVRSYYKWEGKLASEEEVRLWVKTTEKNAFKINDTFEGNHPYDTPQWIWMRSDGGNPLYHEWVRNSVSQ